MQLKVMALSFDYLSLVYFTWTWIFVAEEFPVWHRLCIISLNVRHNFSRLQSIRDSDVYTMVQDWILLIHGDHKSGHRSSSRNSLSRSAQDRRSRPRQLSPRFLSWSPLLSGFLVHRVSESLTTSRISGLISVLLPGISSESRVTLIMMAPGEHLSVYYSNRSISSNLSPRSEIRDSHNRHHQDDQWPSWVSPSPSVTTTPPLASNSTPSRIDMSPCHWCLRARVSAY